jgi:3'-phosphoadenosine 5'-phosphosulfate sulfotransferase (PAPS reductase)/FAD synthetase
MKSPYFIDEPAAISFSGGRTSAYMLYKILEAHDGKLPDDVVVTFANTGKEMPETLDFVQACSDNWDVPIVWLELENIRRMVGEDESQDMSTRASSLERTYKVVDYKSASRNGEPFNKLLKGLPIIPNAVQRTCTVNLKIRAMKWYLQSIGYESPWLQCVGIRADEQRRAIKLHGKISEGHEAYCPLYVDGVTAKDVGDFWSSNNFDLDLPNNNGVTDWGNCDLCHLKGRSKRLSIIRERPDLADWWIAAEKGKGQQFRPGEPSYEQMKVIASDQGQLFDFDDESIPCFCGD